MFIFLLLCGARNTCAEQGGLQFGLINTMKAEAEYDIWHPLIQDLSAGIGIPITAKVYDDYAGVVWAMEAGKVQIASMGNASAIEAVDRAGAEIALRKVDIDGTDGYYSHLITQIDSGLTSLADVFSHSAGLTFGYGDPNSTSGYVVPNYYLFNSRSLKPKKIFKRVTQGNHEENLIATAGRTVDIATSNSIQLKRFQIQDPVGFAKIRILWTSPLIPSDPVVWLKSLPEEQKASIRKFMLNYGRPAPDKSGERLAHETAVLGALTVSGFIVSDNRQLLPIRELELSRIRSLTQEDPSIPQEQRDSRLREIEAKLDMIRKERNQPDR